MSVEKNKAPTITEDGKLSYTAYWDTGRMLILREALDHDHPENLYNHLKAHNIDPSEWGVKCPLDEMCSAEYGHLTREELIAELVKAKREIDAAMRAGF